MVEKTRAIVLHRLNYSDSGIVVQVYTRRFGRLPFLIRGMRNKKAGRHNIFFQPMFILDLVLYHKSSREMQVLKEFSAFFIPSHIHDDIRKISVAIFLGDILASVLKEETANEELFDFIEESVIYFDGCRENFANFHVAFLSGLSSYLGFEPQTRASVKDLYFDMINGTFVPSPPLHGNFAGREISDILASFFSTSYGEINNISLTGAVRNDVLETLVKYYSIHLPGLKKIRSLEVLKEVFG